MHSLCSELPLHMWRALQPASDMHAIFCKALGRDRFGYGPVLNASILLATRDDPMCNLFS